MSKHHNKPPNSDSIDLKSYFDKPVSAKQKQYETIRAVIVDKLSAEQAAIKFGYTVNTVYSLIKEARAGKLDLFIKSKKGPAQRRTSLEIQQKIIAYRKESLSSKDIHKKLAEEQDQVSVKTIERILKENGFGKLKRRTHKELGLTRKNKIIAQHAENLDFNKLEPFSVDCPVSGVFFFIPYIIESGILDVVKKCKFPESGAIGSVQACLSMLLLKLIGHERLSHMDSYDHEPGLAIFASLNRLPSATYMSTYSCRTSESMLLDFQKEIMNCFLQVYPEFYQSQFINLDFHSIPHYGDESQMEKIWCGARGKTMKGANTIFAQDGQSNAIIYTRADILRKEESNEIKKFISFWKSVKGNIKETLVFDCKFTKYAVLDELSEDGIHFITLRKRNKNLIEKTLQIPNEKWQKIELSIPKRKHKKISVSENEVKLTDCNHTFRQIIIKDHGRQQPTFIITNNENLTITIILEVYAKRWHIENKLSELVSFFNLNALSSPLMIRIHFDVLWTLAADTLYHRFAQDLRRFEKCEAQTIFRQFINMPGQVVYDGDKFTIKIRKRASTPILKSIEKLSKPFQVPWLNNIYIEIIWTP